MQAVLDAVCGPDQCGEIYKFVRNGDGDLQNPNDPPPNRYAIRSSEFSNPIQLNDNFWATKPNPPVEDPPGSGNYVTAGGVLADWANGFTSDKREGKSPCTSHYHRDVEVLLLYNYCLAACHKGRNSESSFRLVSVRQSSHSFGLAV